MGGGSAATSASSFGFFGGRGAKVSASSGSLPAMTRPAKSGLAVGSGTALTVSTVGSAVGAGTGTAATTAGRIGITSGLNSQFDAWGISPAA